MRENSGKGEGTNNLHDPTLKEKERARGRSGNAVHGGDLAPPNKDDAGRVIAPEKGEPEKH
jgi:hypothetical protein